MTETAEKPTQSPDRLLADSTARIISSLQHRYLSDESSAVRSLALLRRDSTGTSPEAWELLYGALPESLYGQGDEPSWAERSFAATLSLYATHQQGRSKAMHSPGRSLGQAVRLLMLDLGDDSATMRRFKTLGTATTWAGRVHHLRGLVTQLRSASIAYDYGQLARDLYQLQNPRTADSVRQRWGRDVHRQIKSGSAEPANTNSSEGDNQ